MQHKQRLYGRRIGRPLNKTRRAALEDLYPRLAIPDALLKEDASLTPEALFGRPHPEIWMEIGFGNGEHLSALMEKHPQYGFIGAEPFINGMAAFLKSISLCAPCKNPLTLPSPPQGGEGFKGLAQAKTAPYPELGEGENSQGGEPNPKEIRVRNIRVLMDDAMRIAHSLTDHSLTRLYILNPDPWPKARHHKRRIVNRRNLDAFARILKPGGLLIMATDVAALADWMAHEADTHPEFEWCEDNKRDWAVQPADWAITTRYAAKGEQAGRQEVYLIFKKC